MARYTIARSADDGGRYRVTVVERHRNAGGRPTGFSTIHEIGHVRQDGRLDWVAFPVRPDAARISGYATRKAAAECLYDDWAADHLSIVSRINLRGGR